MSLGNPGASANSIERKGQIRIATLGREDVDVLRARVRVLKDLIALNDDQYPGIDHWFASKVVPGLQSGERRAYIAYEHNKPIAAAILKMGTSAKFCHVRINEDYQNADIGQLLFVQMTLDVLGYAKGIHFTLPESLWTTKSGFFKSFGFSLFGKASHHYRKNDDELSCSATISTVYSAVLKKIPGLLRRFCLRKHPEDANLLMSIRPAFAEKLLDGSKSIEIRKRFSKRWIGHDVVLYASKPQGSLVGKAKINSVTKDVPTNIWSQFESKIGCSKSDFDAYVGSATEVAAIEIKDAVPYWGSVPLKQLSTVLSLKLTPPQSYCEVSSRKISAWMNAIYFAEMLQLRKTPEARETIDIDSNLQ